MSLPECTEINCREGSTCASSPMKVQVGGPMIGFMSSANSLFSPPPGLENAREISPPPGLEHERLRWAPPLELKKTDQFKLPPISDAVPISRPPGFFPPKDNTGGSLFPRLQRAAYANVTSLCDPGQVVQAQKTYFEHQPVWESFAARTSGPMPCPEKANNHRRSGLNAMSKGRAATNPKNKCEPQPADDSQSYAKILATIRRSGSESQLKLQDVVPHILDLARDKDGVQFLMAKLDDTTPSVKMLCQVVLTETSKLAIDQYGHLLLSKLLEVAAKEQQWALAVHLVRSVKQLTCDVHGCRVVQTALQQVSADLQVELAHGLKESIVHCMKNIHGNHVVQLCVEQLKPESVVFVTDAINAWGADKASVHPYACRVVMRLLEFCQKQPEVQEMRESILNNIRTLAMNRYGNYVAQHILEHGNLQHRQRLTMGCIEGGIAELARHKYAHNVVQKCFEADETSVVHALLSTPLEDLISDRFGSLVLQFMLDLSTGATRELLVQRLAVVKSQLADVGAAELLSKTLKAETAIKNEQQQS